MRFSSPTSSDISSNKTIVFDNVRVSVITDRIIRVEKCDDGVFEDRPTQMVFDRNFANTHFKYEICGDKIVVETQKKVFSVDKNTLFD